MAEGERVNRIQRLRGRVKDLQAEVRDVKAELALSRDSVRDVNPDLPLPDDVRRVVDGVLADKLTYLTPENVAALARLVLETERRALPGLIVEAGTALGGSAIVMAAAKAPGRPMKVYDVFGMIPAPTERDGVDVHQRYEEIAAGRSQGLGGDDVLRLPRRPARRGHRVVHPARRRPASNHVELVQGLFEDTIDLDEPVALAHLDGDWYESTMTCLERIAPLLVPGGRIVLDDYYVWSGCREAVDEYFADRSGYRLEHRSKLHVVREQRTG